MLPSPSASERDEQCLRCHVSVLKGTFLHEPVKKGCASCHKTADSSGAHGATKDRVSGWFGSGQSELCFSCHDRSKLSGKYVHAPVSMGYCTGCHNPHNSEYPKLLKAAAGEVCFICHDKSGFRKKIVHGPVSAGMCIVCHSPHASEERALLRNKPAVLCFNCHPEVTRERHVTADTRHPLGAYEKIDEDKRVEYVKKIIKDPARPGKEFYCGSCHDPHSADTKYLLRYQPVTMFDLCKKCHPK